MRSMRWGLMLLLLCAVAAQAQTLPANLDTANVLTGVEGAVGVRHAGDGSGRLFLIQRQGQIRVINAAGTLESTAFLNLVANPPPLGFFNISDPTGGDERGLLGLAFHPQYAINGRFFVYYLDSGSDTVVAEYQVSAADPDVADPASARVILRVYQPATNHNGGDIHFGPDGYLYIGLGDGGGSNDSACGTGQALIPSATSCSISGGNSFLQTPPAGVPRGNTDSRALLGKMLRIDVDVETPRTPPPAGADLCGADSDTGIAPYDIPTDNPFAGNSGSNAAACDEIYHYGLRNPFRWSFDRATDDLIIGDVGQGRWEEVDLVGPGGGLNFGWNPCEGFHVRGSTTDLCTLVGRTEPIMVYGRTTGFSISGGYRYRGPYPQLDGVLFFADFGGALFAQLQGGGGAWTSPAVPWRTGQGSISGFGEDEGGSVYYTTLSGSVRRFVLTGTPLPPQLTLNKFAQITSDGGVPGMADPGDVITYTVNALNSGGGTLTGLSISDSLNGGAPFALTCTPTTLAPNAGATCDSYTHVVTQAEFEQGGMLTNEVIAIAQDANLQDVTASAQAVVALTTLPFAELTVSKQVQLDPDTGVPGVADAGDTIVYTVSVANSGNQTLNDLAVQDQPDGAAAFALDCAPQTLAPGAIALCDEYSVVVSQDQIEAQQPIGNTATATALDPGAAIVMASDDAAVPVVSAAPALTLTKSAILTTDGGTPGVADAGDVIGYSVTVTNSGNVALANLQVTDAFGGGAPLPLSCTPVTLAPAQQVLCAPYQHSVTQADVDAGVALVNAASADASVPSGGAPVSAGDSASIAVAAAAPALTLDKSAALNDLDGDDLADAGETISYGFVVSNSGNVSLSLVAVQDAMLGGTVTCAPTSLTPGATANCGPVDYTVLEADMENAAIENSATAQGTAPGAAQPTVSAPDTTSIATDPGPFIFRDGFES